MSDTEKKLNVSDEALQKKQFIQISDLWKGLVKFWWVMVILGILGGAGIFVRSYYLYQPIYEVSATFTVNTQTLSLTGEGIPSYSYYYDNATAANLANTFPYIIQSNILADAIKEDLGYGYIPASLSADPVESTNMFTLTARGTDPNLTYDVLVSAMKNYPAVAKYLVGNVLLTTISEPEIPEKPVNRFTYDVALKGIGIGCLLGAAWIFAYAFFRRTIKTKSDIHDQLKLETVGTLPEVTFKKYRKQEIDRSILLHNEKIGKGFLESVRVFRNTFINQLDEKEKVVLTTSTAPGEGKTTVITNLAISLADMKKKVLLIDADLRNPSVAGVLNLDLKKLVPAKKTKRYSVYELEEYGFSYLMFTPDNRSYWRIMSVEYLRKLFDSLRGEYDYVLVDTPPCGLVSDTVVVAEAADDLIYVVLQDTVRVSRILSGIDSLSGTGIRLMGAVLNGAQSGIAGYGEDYGYGRYGHYKSYSRYGYGYGYGGYGYGYGYGYGEKRNKKDRKSNQTRQSENAAKSKTAAKSNTTVKSGTATKSGTAVKSETVTKSSTAAKSNTAAKSSIAEKSGIAANGNAKSKNKAKTTINRDFPAYKADRRF